MTAQNGVKDKHSSFPAVDKTMLMHYRDESICLFAFSKYVLNLYKKYVDNAHFALLLFEKNGCLLKISGPEFLTSKLQSDGIKAGTLWDLNMIGHNAVSVGLANGKDVGTIGEENFINALKGYAVYFSPISILNNHPPYHVMAYGGIALITPARNENPEYSLIAFSIANSINTNLHFKQIQNRGFIGSIFAVLVVNINLKNENKVINYHNEALFDILEIPRTKKIEFQPLHELFDPLPNNKDFWRIIDGNLWVENYDIIISVHGKSAPYILSTEPHHQPSLQVRGVTINLTTGKRISADVSRKMGNSAVVHFSNIIGSSPKLTDTIQRASVLANSNSMMMLGESGTGKDVFAQAIHNASDRKKMPFVALNCSALPRDLVASELFGYDPGAFTGAKRQGNIGKFELANGGTIFLDEIGELPLDLQATLLRVVENKQLMRIGGRQTIDVDVKIIAATNANIPAMIEQRLFREDLYYRLSTLELQIPPLRERGEDVILLAEHFIREISVRIARKDIMTISTDTRKLLLKLQWHGNVRELQNLIERIVQLYPDAVIVPKHILDNITPKKTPNRTDTVDMGRIPLTKEQIMGALNACGGNRSGAAKYLGIARKTLYRNMERLGMVTG